MRIVIFTSWGGAYANPILKSLLNNNKLEIVRIYSQGVHMKRISNYHPSYYLNYKDNVSEMIRRQKYEDFNIIKSANDKEIIHFVKENKIDYIFTIGYGEILKKEIINAPIKGVINFHPGLLPENQGADPISSVILNNIKTTGVTVHFIDEGVDTGDIILRKEWTYSQEISYIALQLELGFFSASFIEMLLEILSQERINTIKQDNTKSKYYKKPNDEQGLFNFNMSSEEICRIVKTFSGQHQKAYFVFKKHRIYVGNCEIIKNVKGYEETEIIDQALGYLCIASKNGAVLLKEITIDDLNVDLSNQLINILFDITSKKISDGKV